MMELNEITTHPQLWQLAAAIQDPAVRQAAYETAVSAYENARTDGLCHEGALEIGQGVIREFEPNRPPTRPSNGLAT